MPTIRIFTSPSSSGRRFKRSCGGNLLTSFLRRGKCLKTTTLDCVACIAITIGAAKSVSLVALMLRAKHIVKMTSTAQQRKALKMLTGFPALICLSIFSHALLS